MSESDTSLPQAGWYPDPEGRDRLRWWDGSDWRLRFRARPVIESTKEREDELAAKDAGIADVSATTDEMAADLTADAMVDAMNGSDSTSGSGTNGSGSQDVNAPSGAPNGGDRAAGDRLTGRPATAASQAAPAGQPNAPQPGAATGANAAQASAAGPVGSDGSNPTATGGGAARPDWYPDPSGRHEYRYWDGTQWTQNVATGGVQSIDPTPAG